MRFPLFLNSPTIFYTPRTRFRSLCSVSSLSPSHLSNTRELLSSLWSSAIQSCTSSVALDATAGRGSDTLTLSRLLPQGVVHAIDIQQAALNETENRYMEVLGPKATLHTHLMSHENFSSLSLDPGSLVVATYNLGYYPARGASREVVTLPNSTLESLHAVMPLMAVNGVVTVMVYVGHEEGMAEERAVLSWCESLPKSWDSICMTYPSRQKAPRLVVAWRRK